MQTDYSRPPDFASFTTDGHRALARHLPGYRHHHAPDWINRRCRVFDIANRKPIDCGGGHFIKASKSPARFMREEFNHFMQIRGLWQSLFDHWGSMTLPDGRVALHSSPYCDSYYQAESVASDLGLQLLSRPGDMSVYAPGAFWFLWAEPTALQADLNGGGRPTPPPDKKSPVSLPCWRVSPLFEETSDFVPAQPCPPLPLFNSTT